MPLPLTTGGNAVNGALGKCRSGGSGRGASAAPAAPVAAGGRDGAAGSRS